MSISEDETGSFVTNCSGGPTSGSYSPAMDDVIADGIISNTCTNKNTSSRESSPSGEESALWAWPLNEDGFVRCITGVDKFYVALDFKNLLNREADIRKFDNIQSSGSSYTFRIGLCSVKRPEFYFWRLEVYLFVHAEMILVEAYREVFPDYTNVPDVRVTKRLRKVRKTYRLPERYDITTATVNVSESLGAIVIQALPKAPRL